MKRKHLEKAHFLSAVLMLEESFFMSQNSSPVAISLKSIRDSDSYTRKGQVSDQLLIIVEHSAELVQYDLEF